MTTATLFLLVSVFAVTSLSSGDGPALQGGALLGMAGDAAELGGHPIDPTWFPDVRYLGNGNKRTLERFKADWNDNHKGGFRKVKVIQQPDIKKWPKGGDYKKITELLATLPADTVRRCRLTTG